MKIISRVASQRWCTLTAVISSLILPAVLAIVLLANSAKASSRGGASVQPALSSAAHAASARAGAYWKRRCSSKSNQDRHAPCATSSPRARGATPVFCTREAVFVLPPLTKILRSRRRVQGLDSPYTSALTTPRKMHALRMKIGARQCPKSRLPTALPRPTAFATTRQVAHQLPTFGRVPRRVLLW